MGGQQRRHRAHPFPWSSLNRVHHSDRLLEFLRHAASHKRGVPTRDGVAGQSEHVKRVGQGWATGTSFEPEATGGASETSGTFLDPFPFSVLTLGSCVGCATVERVLSHLSTMFDHSNGVVEAPRLHHRRRDMFGGNTQQLRQPPTETSSREIAAVCIRSIRKLVREVADLPTPRRIFRSRPWGKDMLFPSTSRGAEEADAQSLGGNGMALSAAPLPPTIPHFSLRLCLVTSSLSIVLNFLECVAISETVPHSDRGKEEYLRDPWLSPGWGEKQKTLLSLRLLSAFSYRMWRLPAHRAGNCAERTSAYIVSP